MKWSKGCSDNIFLFFEINSWLYVIRVALVRYKETNWFLTYNETNWFLTIVYGHETCLEGKLIAEPQGCDFFCYCTFETCF